ncbi:hypothetical protein H2248_002823 [Termitomyces sp. 'cryptogamus']|nr:hypothetical protein H2248_002823 [Termitomyces sp. 'cryptogamus']
MAPNPGPQRCREPGCRCSDFYVELGSLLCLCGHEQASHGPSTPPLPRHVCAQSNTNFQVAESNPTGRSLCRHCCHPWYTHDLPGAPSVSLPLDLDPAPTFPIWQPQSTGASTASSSSSVNVDHQQAYEAHRPLTGPLIAPSHQMGVSASPTVTFPTVRIP